MEQQEEEKISGIRIERQSSPPPPQVSNSISSLPNDLTFEILLKLNAKSIVRSRCVSNLWSSITTDPFFIKSFATRSLLLKPNILVFFKKTNKLFVFTFPQHHQNEPSYSCEPLDSYEMECPKSLSSSFTESVHGLLCYSKSPTAIVWNPTMRQFSTLPKPEKSWKGGTVFLGYDPIEGKHKVVCMPRDKFCDECRVFTVGSAKKSWRRIKTNYNHLPLAGNNGRCINGVVYYKACLDHMNHYVIMSFDVRSLKFQAITLPPGTKLELLMIAYEGRFSLVQKNKVDSIKLWVLEDAEKQEWSDKSFLTPLKFYDTSLQIRFKLSGVTDVGEFIYLPTTITKSWYMLYFHPEINSFRKVEFQGIVDEDDKFRHINRFEDSHLHGLQSFPNHIHSLSSL